MFILKITFHFILLVLFLTSVQSEKDFSLLLLGKNISIRDEQNFGDLVSKLLKRPTRSFFPIIISTKQNNISFSSNFSAKREVCPVVILLESKSVFSSEQIFRIPSVIVLRFKSNSNVNFFFFLNGIFIYSNEINFYNFTLENLQFQIINRIDAQGSMALVQVGNDLDWDGKENATIDLTLNLPTIEYETRNAKFRTNSRLFYLWAILEKKLNFSSVYLTRYSYLQGKNKSKAFSTKEGFSGLFLCVNCAIPARIMSNLQVLTTLQTSFSILYCSDTVEMGRLGMFDIYEKSCHSEVWVTLLALSVFFGFAYRNPFYALDFWTVLVGQEFQRKWPTILKICMPMLIFVHYEFSCWMTTECVSPLPPELLQTIAQFFKQGFKIFSRDLLAVQSYIEEFPTQFERYGLSEDSDEIQLGRLFDIDPNVTHAWDVYNVAYKATKGNPRKRVGTKVDTRFASQNIQGIEFAINGIAQCHIVKEEFGSHWYTFWFRGPYSTPAYKMILALLQGGFHNFWEDFYFAGGERHVEEIRKNMTTKGILSAADRLALLTKKWRFYNIFELYLIFCSACIIFFIGEKFFGWMFGKAFKTKVPISAK